MGKKNKIPWTIPDDLKFFKKTTMGCPVIMGRTTWESIPEKFRPLSGRYNIVVTSRADEFEDSNNVVFTFSPESALVYAVEHAVRHNEREIFVIGGASIYEQFLNMKGVVDRVIVSHIKDTYDGDVYFPELDLKDWGSRPVKEFTDFYVIEYLSHNSKRS